MRRDVPEPWAGWLVDAGLTSPNARKPIPSARRLAERVGVHTTTVMNMMHGAADTDRSTVEAVAGALGMDVRRVADQVGYVRTETAPWVPPMEANYLSRRQRLALSELIKAMAEERGTGVHTAPTKQAGPHEGPAHIPTDPPGPITIATTGSREGQRSAAPRRGARRTPPESTPAPGKP